MLKFYYHPLSPIARRVWLALLEKNIPFEPVLVDLKERANLTPEYLALNPFHHVPVVVDHGVRILESFAILDYLEAKFPESTLSPQQPAAIARMRMLQMVTANELVPKLPSLVLLEEAPESDPATRKQVNTVLTFLTEELGTANYFGGDRLNLADITVGAAVPLIVRLGWQLENYPRLVTWCERITARPAWRQTEPDDPALAAWKRWVSVMVKRKQRQFAKS